VSLLIVFLPPDHLSDDPLNVYLYVSGKGADRTPCRYRRLEFQTQHRIGNISRELFPYRFSYRSELLSLMKEAGIASVVAFSYAATSRSATARKDMFYWIPAHGVRPCPE
jgi:hypothetical protein